MGETTQLTSTADVLDHHLNAILEQDMDELLADYSEDSVVISTNGTFHGLDDIRTVHEKLFEEFSGADVELTIDEQTVDGEIAYLVWHGETPENVYEFATDTYLIRDGVIEAQTYAGKVSPKN